MWVVVCLFWLNWFVYLVCLVDGVLLFFFVYGVCWCFIMIVCIELLSCLSSVVMCCLYRCVVSVFIVLISILFVMLNG